jgi:hypothetical protein
LLFYSCVRAIPQQLIHTQQQKKLLTLSFLCCTCSAKESRRLVLLRGYFISLDACSSVPGSPLIFRLMTAPRVFV